MTRTQPPAVGTVVHQRGLGQVATFCHGGHVSVPLGLAYRWEDVTCARCVLAPARARAVEAWDLVAAAYGPAFRALGSVLETLGTVLATAGASRSDEFTLAR